LLLLFGILTLFVSIFSGISFYLSALTFFTLIAILVYLADKKLGLTIIFIVSIAWLLRYFERVYFLLFYNPQNLGRWTLVVPFILTSIPLFFLSYIYKQRLLNRVINLKRLAIFSLLIPFLTLLSFVRKVHTNQFNCWYDIDQSSSNYKITFAVTPEHFFEVYSSSTELKDFIQKTGIKDQFRPGVYCPETEVKIVTRFTKVTSVSIIGFHNTEKNKYYNLRNPIEIDFNQIRGDKSILEPNFEL
jgi:hypothetical protein